MPRQRARILMEPDFRLMESLIHSQQNFVLSDPSMPGNPYRTSPHLIPSAPLSQFSPVLEPIDQPCPSDV